MAGFLSWVQTKLHWFVNTFIRRLEVLLVWYLKFSGQRNIEKYWTKQLSTRESPALPTTNGSSAGSTHTTAHAFDICLATVLEHGARVHEISSMINAAYVRELKDALLEGSEEAEAAFSRTTSEDIQRRLLTDDEVQQLKSLSRPPIINRVLFLAISKEGAIVGTCAATLAAPWCPSGCGSWGLLAVSTPKLGVGRALVEHCEQYIKIAMLERVRIEYFFIAGLASSETLRTWYEERLHYSCFKAPSTGRSYRGNEVRGEVAFRHCEKNVDLSDEFQKESVGAPNEKSIFETRRNALAKFLLAGAEAK